MADKQSRILELLKDIESYDFDCTSGNLTNFKQYIELKEILTSQSTTERVLADMTVTHLTDEVEILQAKNAHLMKWCVTAKEEQRIKYDLQIIEELMRERKNK